VLPRLALLGSSIETARVEYEAIVAEALEMGSYSDPPEPKPDLLSFEEYCALACRYPLSTLTGGFVTEDEEAKGRLKADKDFDGLMARGPLPTTVSRFDPANSCCWSKLYD
jgi:hypothetical protein